MKLLAASLLLVAASALAFDSVNRASASEPEKRIILRVSSAEPGKLVLFSGAYRFDTDGIQVSLENRPTPFGVMMPANALRAEVRKQSGDSKLFVEVLEYTGREETGSMTGPGNSFEIESRHGGVSHFKARQ